MAVGLYNLLSAYGCKKSSTTFPKNRHCAMCPPSQKLLPLSVL